MEITFSEMVRTILKRKNMSVENLADMLGKSRQNMNQQLLRDNFKYKDMVEIAAALGYDLKVDLVEKH